ncbi:unnamed protein product [Polarella glacialis]|uniref:Uncharacterized protein n=1 Tax=Polarella glacialis TaxID=89957 RepID=A0A813HMA7_POLGL|nr:unnamed protein product [Polarella glacialis]
MQESTPAPSIVAECPARPSVDGWLLLLFCFLVLLDHCRAPAWMVDYSFVGCGLLRAPAWIKESTLAPTQESFRAPSICSVSPNPKPYLKTNSLQHKVVKKGGKRQLVLGILISMPDMRLIPNQVSYNAAIAAYSKRGKWELALNLLV